MLRFYYLILIFFIFNRSNVTFKLLGSLGVKIYLYRLILGECKKITKERWRKILYFVYIHITRA